MTEKPNHSSKSLEANEDTAFSRDPNEVMIYVIIEEQVGLGDSQKFRVRFGRPNGVIAYTAYATIQEAAGEIKHEFRSIQSPCYYIRPSKGRLPKKEGIDQVFYTKEPDERDLEDLALLLSNGNDLNITRGGGPEGYSFSVLGYEVFKR